jgi:uncharacterized protein (TIGR00251 family)
MRLEVHAHPGSRNPGVGGTHDGRLAVRIREPAIEGKANDAIRRALADAFDVPPSDVQFLNGATSRHKLYSIDGDEPVLEARLAELKGSGAEEPSV